MKKSYFKWSLCVALSLMPLLAYLQDLHLIPSPQSIEIKEQVFEVGQSLNVYTLMDKELSNPIQEQMDLLREKFALQGSETSKNVLWYGIVDQDPLLNAYCQKNNIEVPKHREGYICHSSNDTIVIAANQNAGLLYGLYTLEQLVDNTKDQHLPEVTVVDYPNIDHRAIMDDISRGPLSNMTFLKSQIKRLSKLKINILTFYIEHVVKTKNHPDFAPYDAITIEEFEELTEFAKPYNVELMGGFQSLGHFRNVLQSETYRHLGQTDRMLKPGDPEALEFLKSVYAEMLPAFSSDYFNIYADEAWDLVRMDEGLTVDSSAAAKRYLDHVNPLVEYLSDLGKTAIVCSDMLLSFPETIDLISKKSTILSWVYDDLENYDDWIDPFREAGLDYWVCPGILNSYQVFPDYDVTFNNLEKFINAGYEKEASGVMTSIWDDGAAHFFARDWPAIAFAAAQSWKPRRNHIAKFKRNFSFLMYGNEGPSLLECIGTISELKNTKAFENLGTSFLDEYLLPDEGEIHYLNTSEAETISKIVREGRACFDAISRPNEAPENLWNQDLKAWYFALDQISLQVKTYEKLIDLLDLYVGENLSTISNELEELMESWQDIKSRFTKLWLEENRNYWLEEEWKIYNRKIASLSKLKNRIDSLIEDQVPLPSATSIGIDVRPVDKDFFTYWLISEKYDASNPSAIDKDFLSALGGEQKAIPTPYDWTKYQSPYSYKIDFEDVDRASIVYLYSRIETEEGLEIFPEIGFPGRWKMILNGEIVLDNNAKGHEILLKTGKNHVILKLELDPEAHQIQFNLKESSTTNRKYKYKLITE